MRTDGRPDMTTLMVAFQNSANAPKIVCIHSFPIPLHTELTRNSTQRSQQQYET